MGSHMTEMQSNKEEANRQEKKDDRVLAFERLVKFPFERDFFSSRLFGAN